MEYKEIIKEINEYPEEKILIVFNNFTKGSLSKEIDNFLNYASIGEAEDFLNELKGN